MKSTNKNVVEKKIIKFANILGKLKRAKRAGWVKRKIPNSESIAEHMYRMAVLAMFLAPSGINQNKAIRMALIHDIGEAEIGDIITHEGKRTLSNLKNKLQKERTSLLKILSIINKEGLIELFDEFEEGKTEEAKFVKQLDRLEAAIQASEYRKYHDFDVDAFYDYAETITTNVQLKKILNQLRNGK